MFMQRAKLNINIIYLYDYHWTIGIYTYTQKISLIESLLLFFFYLTHIIISCTFSTIGTHGTPALIIVNYYYHYTHTLFLSDNIF